MTRGTASPTGRPMTEGEKANVQVVLDFVGSWGKDFDAEKEYGRAFTDDARARWEAPEDSPVQWDGMPFQKGIKELAAGTKQYMDSGLVYEAVVHNVHAIGPIVVIERDDVLKRPDHPDKPVPAVGVFHFKNGKIAEWSDYLGDSSFKLEL